MQSELKAFANNIWVIEGPDAYDFGLMFTTRMVIVKLSDGSLWVNSPIQISPETIQAIKALGSVQYLIAATPRHIWRLEEWQALFPEAQLWTTKVTHSTLNSGKVPLAMTLDEKPYPGWAFDIEQTVFKGNPLIEETIFFHKESRTVILDDLIQNHPLEKNRSLKNALIQLGGVASPNGGVPLDIRLSFINHKLARKALKKLLSWDFDKLIIGHGPCIKQGAKPIVEQAFKWLSR